MAAQEQEQQAKTSATSSLPTSSERSSSSAPSNNREGGNKVSSANLNFSPLLFMLNSADACTSNPSAGAESDEEIRRVPEIGSGASASSGAGGDERGKPGLQLALAQGQQPAAGKKRGRAAGDKEQNRLKRLLRNRVSAQQARERKKAYLTELEAKAKDLEHRNAELEQRVSTLQNETTRSARCRIRFSPILPLVVTATSADFKNLLAVFSFFEYFSDPLSLAAAFQILKNTTAHAGKRGGGGAGAKGGDGGKKHHFTKS
ncbi:hypothetical protein PR202_ga23314 [Eleusine coracana subsp. coracana]|uniref:BZIP domain-containing protein n=1 Tax=Eleusine coracana subsp. coracana TaxID=191504 RepID=A0AAV5D4W1_ELECO|nr:hypothetical protein PR202_ga23314 [Eleusine coracana subsp. coracana]